MEYYCYIIYSKAIDSYYIGYTSDIQERLKMHNNGIFGRKSFTSKAKDWEVYLIIKCKTINHAIALERFVKKQKSRKYIENLKHYPELLEKVIKGYS